MVSFMMFLAQTGQPVAAQQGPGGIFGSPIIFFVLIFAMFYFMIIRPQNRKEKERKTMIAELKTGARVVFAGMIGTVTNVKDDVFVIKIADNVKVEVLRDAVSRVLEKGEKVSGDKRS